MSTLKQKKIIIYLYTYSDQKVNLMNYYKLKSKTFKNVNKIQHLIKLS